MVCWGMRMRLPIEERLTNVVWQADTNQMKLHFIIKANVKCRRRDTRREYILLAVVLLIGSILAMIYWQWQCYRYEVDDFRQSWIFSVFRDEEEEEL